jgi:hypothetical protein
MVDKFNDKKGGTTATKPQPTGRKATINGYETEEYSVVAPTFKAAYWVAPTFPDGAAILRQLQAIKSEIWNSASGRVPNYRDFPALPIRTVVEMGNSTVTTTVTSIKQDVLSEADFAIPKDFKEMNSPAINSMVRPEKAEPAGKPLPSP